jgi:hypothetical protein
MWPGAARHGYDLAFQSAGEAGRRLDPVAVGSQFGSQPGLLEDAELVEFDQLGGRQQTHMSGKPPDDRMLS